MAKEHHRLKLGKRASFVKAHLKQLPQEEETWEVDFRALPKPADQTDTHYLGLAVALPRGDPLVYLPVEYTPTVNDLADLLDRKSTRLNSSHMSISYAVFCLKKKKIISTTTE